MLNFRFDMPTDLEAVLEPQCRVIERLPNRRVLDIWRQWNVIYPSVFQFSSVRGNLRNRRSLEAYQEQDPRELFVLTVGSLAGWRCECEKPPLWTDVFVIAVVTPPDFSWAFDQYDFLYRDDALARSRR